MTLIRLRQSCQNMTMVGRNYDFSQRASEEACSKSLHFSFATEAWPLVCYPFERPLERKRNIDDATAAKARYPNNSDEKTMFCTAKSAIKIEGKHPLMPGLAAASPSCAGSAP